jgi:septal ring-binding cell division protein DamX
MADKETKKNWFARHKVLTVILALVVIGVIASAAGGGNKSSDTKSNSTSTSEAKAKSEAQTIKVGEAARDGKFEFTIKSVECGKASVGPNQYATKTAQGQYCLMTLDVKNIGNSQQYFSESDQKLLNASGMQYSPDNTATLYNSNNSDALLAQINPGNTVEGVLVFDIPKDQTPVTAELHDSGFSGGVEVTLQ